MLLPVLAVAVVKAVAFLALKITSSVSSISPVGKFGVGVTSLLSSESFPMSAASQSSSVQSLWWRDIVVNLLLRYRWSTMMYCTSVVVRAREFVIQPVSRLVAALPHLFVRISIFCPCM